jgi:integrase
VHHRFALDRYTDKPIRKKDDARTEVERLRTAIRANEFPATKTPVPSDAGALTFDQFTEKWRERARAEVIDTQKVNDAGICKRLGALTLAAGQQLGDTPIGAITEDDLETAFRQLNNLAGATWNKYRQTVFHLQKWGRRKGYLARPWLTEDTEIARKKGARRDRRLVPDVLDDKGRVKEPGEERRLLAGASAWLQRLIIAALETCCRRGELLSLQWRDVDLQRGKFRVRAENAKDSESRDIPILPRLRSVLDLIKNDPAGEPHKPEAYVFGDAVGGHIANPKKSWLKCCAEAGVKGLHFHDLRHEAASRLGEAGWPLHHVQAMLGHADAKTTSIYLNVTFDGLADSARRFSTSAVPLHELAPGEVSSLALVSNGRAKSADKLHVN